MVILDNLNRYDTETIHVKILVNYKENSDTATTTAKKMWCDLSEFNSVLDDFESFCLTFC